MQTKTLLVVSNIPKTHKKLKRFEKMLTRSFREATVYKVCRGIWLVKTGARPGKVAARLDALICDKDDGNYVLVTTLLPDAEHLAGWIEPEAWQFVGM